jgi:hypothetical protein
MDEDHGHVAVADDDGSRALLRATGSASAMASTSLLASARPMIRHESGSVSFSQILATRSPLGGRSLARFAVRQTLTAAS